MSRDRVAGPPRGGARIVLFPLAKRTGLIDRIVAGLVAKTHDEAAQDRLIRRHLNRLAGDLRVAGLSPDRVQHELVEFWRLIETKAAYARRDRSAS